MAANTCCRSAASASTLMLAPWLAGRARTRLGAIPDLEPLENLEKLEQVEKVEKVEKVERVGKVKEVEKEGGED